MKRCYDCGVELNSANRTKEHIPARNLYAGYSEKHKENRLTVPACRDCNFQYSKIDHEVRDAIGIMNENNSDQKELTGKAIRSILRNSNWENRFSGKKGSLPSIQFQMDDFTRLHTKNFKGIFYNAFGIPLPKEFEIGVVSEGHEADKQAMRLAQFFYNYIAFGDDWSHSGHEDVFRFKIKAFCLLDDGQIGETNNMTSAIGVSSVMIYHNKLCPVIFALKSDFIDQTLEGKQP